MLLSVRATLLALLMGLAYVGCAPTPGGENTPTPDGGPSIGGPNGQGTGPGERFAETPRDYAVPAGGITIQGFAEISRQEGFENVGDEYWVVRDMTGDGLLDLVVTTVIRDVLDPVDPEEIFDEPYGYPTTPVWHVYPGSANGFSSQFIKWTLPKGGLVNRGFHRARNQEGAVRGKHDRGALNKAGDEAWTLQDMNGDGKPDLVVTGVATELVMIGYVFKEYGTAQSPSWKVYSNTGNGFETAAKVWTLPTVFDWDNFGGLAGEASGIVAAHRHQLWQLADMNGDRKPDLVAYAEVQTVGTGTSTTYRARPWNHPAAPRWEVFINSGTGFATASTRWLLPRQRGIGDNGLNALVGAGNADGDSQWALQDMDGDAKPDLVVTGLHINDQMKAVGYPSDSHWEIYSNTGSGFGALKQWALPRGGSGSSGFFTLASAGASIAGDDAWTTVDLNGDGKLELVITGEFLAGANAGVYGLGRLGNDPHWLVHGNSGEGFAAEAKTWKLPAGGLRELGFNSTFGVGSKIGDEGWSLMDMDGDKQPELVVLSNTIERPDSPGFDFTLSVIDGFGDKPRWRVFNNVP
jgi:hypothetical protein